jgi:hypothetical protein
LTAVQWQVALTLIAVGGAGCATKAPNPAQLDKDAVTQGAIAAGDAAGDSADAAAGADTSAVAADVDAVGAFDGSGQGAADAKPAPPGPRKTWSPSYPGIFYGCSSVPAESECFMYVHPLPEDPATFVKACEDGEKLHIDGCPAVLDGESIVATCQDTPDPTTAKGFAPYMVYAVYEGQILQSAKDEASPTETATQACKRLITEFKGRFCPEDSVIVDIGLGSINCEQLK